MGELIMLLFHARTTAHVLHLKTRSFAVHKALEDFYEGIIDLADSIAEAHQGCEGLITAFPARYTPYEDPLLLMSSLYDWIDANRDRLSDETQIQNLIDEVLALINSTTYKLKFLK